MKSAIPLSIDRPMVLPKAFYLLYYGAAASLLPFLPIYYQSIGLSGKEIGVLVAIPPLLMLVGAPLWGGLADATHQHKRLLMLAVSLALISVVALSLTSRFVIFIPVVAAYALFIAPVMPLIDNTVLEMLGERRTLFLRGGQKRDQLAHALAGDGKTLIRGLELGLEEDFLD